MPQFIMGLAEAVGIDLNDPAEVDHGDEGAHGSPGAWTGAK